MSRHSAKAQPMEIEKPRSTSSGEVTVKAVPSFTCPCRLLLPDTNARASTSVVLPLAPCPTTATFLIASLLYSFIRPSAVPDGDAWLPEIPHWDGQRQGWSSLALCRGLDAGCGVRGVELWCGGKSGVVRAAQPGSLLSPPAPATPNSSPSRPPSPLLKYRRARAWRAPLGVGTPMPDRTEFV